MNALIQGGAARHTKLWMRACWCEGIIPLLQMHDCLDCSVNSREQAELVARLGCEAVQLDVPMRVDLTYGRTWGDAKYTWEELHGAAAPAKPTKVNGHTFEAAPIPAAPIALPEHIAPEPEPESLDERLQKIPLADLIGEPLVHGKICCPFHDDDTPSLHIYSDHYYCFGCGVHGGHLDWLREAEGLITEDAIKVIFDWQPTSAPRQTRQESDTRTLEWALALWHAAEPIADTPPNPLFVRSSRH